MRLLRLSAPTDLTITGPTVESLPAYDAATTYALGDRVLTTDVSTGFEYIYESAKAGNLGNALADDTSWLFVSAANPWRMFDLVASSQTTSATGSIFTSFVPDPLANTIALLNIVGDSVQVDVLAGGVAVYTKTVSLTFAGDGVTDWYQYFFGDLGRRTSVLFTDLPSYPGEQIRVTLTGSGEVAIGTLGFGYGYDLGETTSVQVGIDDYSRKDKDQFGNFIITPRRFAKNGSFASAFLTGRFDEIAELLPLYRATPAIWIGDDEKVSSYIFGFFKSYKIQAQQEPLTTLQIDIEGLV